MSCTRRFPRRGRVRRSSSMRLAQYTIAGAPGALPVEVVVYFFGVPGQGGDPAANLERWHSQFSSPDGTPVKEVVTHEKSAFPITFAEYRGTYARGVGAGSSAAEARPNHLLMAAIAETPGSLFVRAMGRRRPPRPSGPPSAPSCSDSNSASTLAAVPQPNACRGSAVAQAVGRSPTGCFPVPPPMPAPAPDFDRRIRPALPFLLAGGEWRERPDL